jgi:hypothetical protein
MDPHSMAVWIRLRIPNADADPGPRDLKRAKRKEKTPPKDRLLGIKSIKRKVIHSYKKENNVTLFSLKSNI